MDGGVFQWFLTMQDQLAFSEHADPASHISRGAGGRVQAHPPVGGGYLTHGSADLDG